MIGSGYLQDINVFNFHPHKLSQSKIMDDNFETHRVLQQVKRKTEILNVQSADLVRDHANFTKTFLYPERPLQMKI